MKTSTLLLLYFLLSSATLLSSAARDVQAELKSKHIGRGHGGGSGVPGFGPDPGGFFGGGPGFNIPGFGGGGWGAGFGGPGGGYAKGGVVPTSVVCNEKGPCYKKRVTCPAKCFTSYSRSGKNYGAGGGGGGCTIDCKKKCVGYC
ncbi:uncharacterized protein [Typha latifolia]|uniref:uncharacterized protein n=1 Tax=Typha latifolia TaxID=4733 RepID=UPI003C2B74AE